MKTIKYSFNYNEHLDIDEEIKLDVVALYHPEEKAQLEAPPSPEHIIVSIIYFEGKDVNHSNVAFIQAFKESMEKEAEVHYWDNYNEIMIKNGLREDL